MLNEDVFDGEFASVSPLVNQAGKVKAEEEETITFVGKN